MFTRKRPLKWLIALCLYAAMSASWSQDDTPLAALATAERELANELAQMDRIVAQDRERLTRAATSLPAADITSALLEDARLNLAALQSRQSGLKTRLQARRAALASFSDREAQLREDLQADGISEEEQVELDNELALVRQQIETLEKIEQHLEQLSDAVDLRVNLARQRQNILQSRFELPSLSEMSKLKGPQVDSMLRQIDEHLVQASRFRSQLVALDRQNNDSDAQARLLELKALAEEERAELLQMTLARLQAERLLTALAQIKSSSATPPRVLSQALENLLRLQDDLRGQAELLANKSSQYNAQLAILTQQAERGARADSTSLDVLQSLLKVIETSSTALQSLESKVQQSVERYREDSALASRSALLERSMLPEDRQGWQQLITMLATLPVRIGDAFGHAIVNYTEGLRDSEPGPLALAIGIILGLLIGFRSLRSRIAPELLNGPLGLIHRHLYAILPVAAVALTGALTGLRDRDLLLLTTPLLIYPLVRIALDFANNFLDVYTPGLDRRRTATLLRETRWVVILSAVLAAVLVCAQTVALAPGVIALIDRAAMLSLLLISVPLLHLRSLLVKGTGPGVTLSGPVGWLTLLLPLALVSCALAGLVGYINLAEAVAIRLGWLCAVAAALHYLHLGLQAGFGLILHRISDADAASFWQLYIFDPLRRVGMVLLAVVAGQWLFTIYGWSAETPIVRILPQLLNAAPFSVGDTPIPLKTLLLGVAIILAAVWGGGWSKQISYRWVYTRVGDHGLRNSLATFTQYLVVIAGVVIALKIIGLDLTALTVFAGALGVGIGFGMQQIVVNFISGILLLIERPLATKDQVAVDKYEGEVTRIGIRSLTVKTWDSQEVIIPNSSVITKPFTNWTRTDDVARTVLMVGISYEDEPRQAIEIIQNILTEHPSILESPAFKVLLWEYADSALLLRVQFFSRIRGDVGRADLRSQVLLEIWDAFKAAGITIPFPQRDVNLRQLGPSTE